MLKLCGVGEGRGPTLPSQLLPSLPPPGYTPTHLQQCLGGPGAGGGVRREREPVSDCPPPTSPPGSQCSGQSHSHLQPTSTRGLSG